MKSFAIRAPEELIEGFRTAAAADDRTFSGALRHAMRQTIEARTDEGPAREPAPVEDRGLEPLNRASG